VAKLLRKGVLVTDGAEHDHLRHAMQPSLHKKMLTAYVAMFCHYTDQVTATWQDGQTRDMLIEMRRVALLILVGDAVPRGLSPPTSTISGRRS